MNSGDYRLYDCWINWGTELHPGSLDLTSNFPSKEAVSSPTVQKATGEARPPAEVADNQHFMSGFLRDGTQDLRDSNLIRLSRTVRAGEVTAPTPSIRSRCCWREVGITIRCWLGKSIHVWPPKPGFIFESLWLEEHHTPKEPSVTTSRTPDSSVICAKALKSNLALPGHLQEPKTRRR